MRRSPGFWDLACCSAWPSTIRPLRRHCAAFLRADRHGGLILIIYLGFSRYDRAILLVPAWTLILVWLFGAWLTVTGQLANDIVQPALVAVWC